MKRQADTTTPLTVAPPPATVEPVVAPLVTPTPSTSSLGAAAPIPNRRESHRQIKRPKKDLPEDQAQHCIKRRAGPLSNQMKFCGTIIKEVFSKKHQV